VTTANALQLTIVVTKLGRMNLLCGIRIWAQVSFILSQSTHLTDRETEKRTERQKNGQTERPWQ